MSRDDAAAAKPFTQLAAPTPHQRYSTYDQHGRAGLRNSRTQQAILAPETGEPAQKQPEAYILHQ
jgi:hypothetical protein